jgi:hypothetical protein
VAVTLALFAISTWGLLPAATVLLLFVTFARGLMSVSADCVDPRGSGGRALAGK